MTSLSSISSISNSIQDVTSQISAIQQQLTTGKAQLDGAKLGQASRLGSKVTVLTQMSSNADEVINAMKIGATGLSSISTIMQQMAQLASQASGGVTTADLSGLNTAFQQLAGQIKTIGTASSYGAVKNFIANTGKLDVAVGLTSTNTAVNFSVSFPTNVSTFTTTFQSLNLASGSTAALTAVNNAMDALSAAQSTLNANVTGLTAALTGTTAITNSTQSALDSLQEIDASALQSQLQELNNQMSIDYYLITQMNQQSAAKLVVFR